MKTIQNWFANSDISSEPGLQDRQLERLKKIAEDYKIKHGRELMCSLIFDEMHIRQQVCWSVHQMDYIGYANYGAKTNVKTVAKQVIVFLLNGIDVNFEFSVAYWFIDELVAKDRQTLLNRVVATVTRCGVKITNITFDGHSANIPAMEMLGANLKINVKGNNRDFKPYILNLITNDKIFIVLDPCHMEKLVRNRWASCKVFIDEKGGKIEWKYVEELYKYSCANDFRTHKLTKKHIQWERNSMSVGLAVETFSDSVASSIEFLMKQGVPEFQGAQTTVDFIRRMNTLFDIFNSRYTTGRNIFKRNLCVDNKRVIYDFFDDTIKFFKCLKTEEVFYKKKKKNVKIGKTKKQERVVSRIEELPILNTRHKVAFRGFIIDMVSLKGMFGEYVEEKCLINSISTYNLQQDAIEMFFGRIRACGGFNNNPNVQQFKGAFRRIQCNMRMDLSPKSNCRMFDMHLPDNLNYSDIYFVSSKRAKIVLDERAYEAQKDSILELVENPECEPIELSHPFDTHHILDTTAHFMITYLASKIEKKIMECKNFHCNDCRYVFDENEKIDSIDAKFASWIPCRSTVEICKTAEQFFKLYDGHESKPAKPRYDFKVLYCLIFRTMNFDLIYPNSKFQCDYSHKYQFIKCVVGQYMTLRANQISKQITLQRQESLIRQQYTHLVNFRGQ